MQGANPILMIQMDVVGANFDAISQKLEEAIEEGWATVAKEIERVWQEKAAQELNSTRDDYLKGLSVDHLGGDLIQATLTGFLPVAIEEGHQGYDMKKGMMGSAVRRVIPIGKRKGGNINFRTMTAASDGWWHPGFQAKQIHKQVQEEVAERVIPEVFGPLISRISL